MKFKPSPPKPAEVCTLTELKRLVRKGMRITGAKEISPSAWKVFTDGPMDFYVETSHKLIAFLEERGHG